MRSRQSVQVEIWIDPTCGKSTGRIGNPNSLLRAVDSLVKRSKVNAVAVVGRFPDDDIEGAEDYRQGKVVKDWPLELLYHESSIFFLLGKTSYHHLLEIKLNSFSLCRSRFVKSGTLPLGLDKKLSFSAVYISSHELFNRIQSMISNLISKSVHLIIILIYHFMWLPF